MGEPTRIWQDALRDLGEQTRTPGTRRQWRVEGLRGGARPFFLFRFLADNPRPSLVISAGAKDAERFEGDLRFFFDEAESRSPFARRIHYLPAWDVVPSKTCLRRGRRRRTDRGTLHLRQSRNPIVFTTPEALLQRVPPLQDFATRYLYLVEGTRLIATTSPSSSTRGDTGASVWSKTAASSACAAASSTSFPGAPKPLRVNLDGDRIETMHEFDPVTQRLRAGQASC